MSERPKIICLCGSTRFYDEFQTANRRLTLEGYIVLTVGVYPHQEPLTITPAQKVALDELHQQKINMADEVFVINKDGYIGESTCSEIVHAIMKGKPIRFLEPDHDTARTFVVWSRHVDEAMQAVQAGREG